VNLNNEDLTMKTISIKLNLLEMEDKPKQSYINTASMEIK